jgi:hypothetical protein
MDSQSRDEYEQRCQTEDADGFNLIFGQQSELVKNGPQIKVKYVPDGFAEPIHNLTSYQEINEMNRLEQQYREHDPVRKYQIDYDESICMVEKFPEAMQIDGVISKTQNSNTDKVSAENENQLFVIAPGEGKTPVNLTFCQDWDAKAFPLLHPDGLNLLTDKRRQRRLAEVDYFKQRMFNKDNRWRGHPHWVFAAAIFKEKKDMQRNIDIGFKKGKKTINKGGQSVYSLDDPYSVFQSVANTPAYHKKGKMETHVGKKIWCLSFSSRIMMFDVLLMRTRRPKLMKY